MTKEDVLKIINYSDKNNISEKESSNILGYHCAGLSYYKHKFNIAVNPIGNAKFTHRFNRKFDVNDNFFSHPSILNSYYAGFIAADGNISRDYRVLTIGLSSKDEKWIEKFQKDINSNHKIHKSVVKNKFNVSTIQITSQQICSDLLNNYNITQDKSLTLMPPNIRSEELINAFICGYIDGDGSIIKYKNVNGYDTINISLLGTLEICSWIKHHFNKYTNKCGRIMRNHNSIKNTYVLTYSTKSARIIFEKLYGLNVPKLERKWKEEIHNFCLTFKKHKPKGTSKGVYIFDLYGNLLKYCNTLQEAEMYTKVHLSRISSLCKKDNHHESNGYIDRKSVV